MLSFFNGISMQVSDFFRVHRIFLLFSLFIGAHFSPSLNQRFLIFVFTMTSASSWVLEILSSKRITLLTVMCLEKPFVRNISPNVSPLLHVIPAAQDGLGGGWEV